MKARFSGPTVPIASAPSGSFHRVHHASYIPAAYRMAAALTLDRWRPGGHRCGHQCHADDRPRRDRLRLGLAWLNVIAETDSTRPAPGPPDHLHQQDNSSAQHDQLVRPWGGVVLSGRAPITDCASPGATPGTVACERQVEGAADPALYAAATATTTGHDELRPNPLSGFVLSGTASCRR